MKEFTLEEKDGHVVSFSEHGNPDGPAILSFHGGPGSKSKPSHAARFDLTKYRVILFDQRGCGKSLPQGCIESNTTDDLIADAERIREYLELNTWFVTGGSWGSTLALLYAIKHPERVRGILLTAVFLADRASVEWAMGEKGAATLMPDVWARRMEFFKKFDIRIENQNEDLLKALEHADLATQKEITAGLQNWEGNLFSPQSSLSYKNPEDVTDADIASARIFLHYEKNHEFLSEGYILANAATIAHIPCVIVHGRYDILCPLEKAKALADALPKAELIIASSSGHALTAEGHTIQKMAFDRFLEKHA